MNYFNKHSYILFIFLTLFSLSIISCGESESDGNDNGGMQESPGEMFDPDPAEPEEEPMEEEEELDPVSMEEASRFLSMATLGADYEEIEKVALMGREQWIDEQFDQPPGYNLPFTLDLLSRVNDTDRVDQFAFRRYSWWQQVMASPDILRQRVAFALSEIFVVSDRLDILAGHPEGMSSFYDVLLEHAFGNYRDLLYDVTLHPAMGVYLNHMNNKKADPEKGRFPDENYARESKQLLSIGLDELNPDGTIKTDSMGFPIPTYDNSDISEFARVFTGLVSEEPRSEEQYINLIDPMVMVEEFHDTDEKTLLNGQVVPAGQSGLQDIGDAVDNLFNHPNTGPFICKQLIQRLVTSNPDPDYVERVANVFADNGSGVRGDFKAVIKAILLDEDAVDLNQMNNSRFGKFHEPWVRYVSVLRQFNAATPDNFYYNGGYTAQFFINQHIGSSPSVFNFFLPDFRPNGIIGDNNLFAPEFQIMTSSTILNYPNLLFIVLFEEEPFSLPDPDFFFFPVSQPVFDFSDEIALASDPVALVDRLDLILTYGFMSEEMKQIIINAVSQLEEPELRVQAALYLFMISPEYVVQN